MYIVKSCNQVENANYIFNSITDLARWASRTGASCKIIRTSELPGLVEIKKDFSISIVVDGRPYTIPQLFEKFKKLY